MSESEVIPPGESLLDLLLWQRARDVRLWASLPKSSRRGMFRRTNAADWELAALQLPEAQPLREPLEMLLAMVRFPDLISGRDIAPAIAAIVKQYLTSRDLNRAFIWTTLHAMLDLDSPQPALLCGRVARQLQLLSISETWYVRAEGIAIKRKDLQLACSARLGRSVTRAERADPGRARSWLISVMRTAERHGFTRLLADAHHELGIVMSDLRDGGAMARHFTEAIQVLRPGAYVAALAVDFALVTAYAGRYTSALDILNSLHGDPDPMISSAARLRLALVYAALGKTELYTESVEGLHQAFADKVLSLSNGVLVIRAAGLVRDRVTVRDLNAQLASATLTPRDQHEHRAAVQDVQAQRLRLNISVDARLSLSLRRAHEHLQRMLHSSADSRESERLLTDYSRSAEAATPPAR